MASQTGSPTSSDFADQLTYLRADAFKVIVAVTALAGYLWLLRTVWPLVGQRTPPEAWFGSVVLCLASVGTVIIRRKRTLSYVLLLSALLVAIVSAVRAYDSVDLVYFLVVTVLFASVLLGQTAVLVYGLLSSGLSIWLVTGLNAAGHQASPLLPALVIGAATFAALASVRNLYTALYWAMKSYERVEGNERLLQEQQSELKQALKSLDTAGYNLERANVMLGLARHRADEALRLKQEFAQNMSHELRTPLNLIVGFSETMMQSPEYYGEPLPTPYLRDLSIVHRNATHLQSLVNDVLDLARIEAAQMTLTAEETDPGELVRDAVSAIRSLVESRGLVLRIETAPDLPPVWVDPTRIRQVIFNILNNAVRFTEQGGVTVTVQRRDDDIQIAIQDTGIGIEPSELSRVFEAFHQTESSLERRRGGIGLGLTISRQFVDLHGGQIWVESEPGRGSTFYFTLPVGPATVRPGRALAFPELSAISIHAAARERLVLVVTRSASAAAMLSRYLRNCRTVFVDSLEQARQFAERGVPQMVLVDAHCEHVSPDELVRLAEAWHLEHVPFLACPLPGEEQLRQRLGTQGYLIKPVSRKSLWDAVLQIPGTVNSVLVVDDDADFVRLMARMLNQPAQRYQVLTAYSAREGLSKVERHRPDLVLMDIGLPDMNGLKLLEQIRANPVIESTAVIVVSGHDDVDLVESLQGALVVTRAAGLLRGDVVQWIQRVLDTATRVHSPGVRDAEGV